MTKVVQWQYPGSKMSGASMSDAATTNDAGERTVQSIQCKSIFTTKDSITNVVQYYKSRLTPPGDSNTAEPEEKPAVDSARSVTFHDDSEGRPLTIHIIVANTDKTSTTLVISRAESEAETHIAWTHYMKF